MTRRPLLAASLSLLALTACMSQVPTAADAAAIPFGYDLGSSTRAPFLPPAVAPRPVGSNGIERIHDGKADAHAVGVVNAVDPAKHTINLTHQPIPTLGWPSMTMDFAVAPSVNLGGIKPGSRVDFTLEKGKGGLYEIQSVQPVRAGQ